MCIIAVLINLEIKLFFFTGAIDIVFVRQRDGRFKSTPFYVKFGKIGVLQAREKVIYIEVNGKEIEQTMVLDDNGTATFPWEAKKKKSFNNSTQQSTPLIR